MGKCTALYNILWQLFFKECSSVLLHVLISNFVKIVKISNLWAFTSTIQTFSFLFKEFWLFTFNFTTSTWLTASQRLGSSIRIFSLISQSVKLSFQSLILTRCCLVIPERYFAFFQTYYKYIFILQGSQCLHITFYFYMNTVTIKHTPKSPLEMWL